MQVILKRKNTETIDRTFNIDEGSVITENYNETLDSATIRVSHISEPIDIEPYDKVILHDEKNRLSDRYMCVDTYTETMESLDPVLYSYEITLFSETKELEGVILPNLSITQLPSGGHRSVIYYIEQYLRLYSPKIRTSTTLEQKYNTTARTDYKFTMDCPEMQWNAPTLREVLTDLMMVADCIPVMKNNMIDFIDLTEKKLPIDESKVNYIQRSQSSEDYVSELRMDLKNSLQTKNSSITQTCRRVEYFTFTTDGYVVTDQNYYLKTQFPINRVNHLWMIFQMAVAQGNDDPVYKTMFKVDLCDADGSRFLYEKQEYDTLAISRLVERGDYILEPLARLSGCSNFCVYYTREGDRIEGFSETQKASDFFKLKTNTLSVLKEIFSINLPDVDGVTWALNSYAPTLGNSYFSTFFEIEYEPLTDVMFQASKEFAGNHQRVVNDNQTNSYADAYNQGFMEYQKANRLGNQQLFINARFEDGYSNIIKIGDYYGDSIIYQTQYQIYENHIEVNAIATKNYILRDYFTGVKARIRSWKIANGSDALIRHELNKFYLEFSFNQKTDNFYTNSNIARYFLSPLWTFWTNPVSYSAVKTDKSVLDSNDYYSLDTVLRLVGNSIVFNFGFEDNFQAGKKVAKDVADNVINSSDQGLTFKTFRIAAENWTNNYGGILLQPLKYVDNNGECVTVSYSFIKNIRNLVPFGDLDDEEEKKLLVTGAKRPIINSSEFLGEEVFHDTVTVDKDNREILKISTQFEFCRDTENIIFTKKFLEYQQCIRNIELGNSSQNLSTSKSLIPSDWTELGGVLKTDANIQPPYSGINDGTDVRKYYGDYQSVVPSLQGETLAELSIEQTVDGYTNTVNFDNNYTEGDINLGARFYGRIYTLNQNEPVTVTITYRKTGAETAYWICTATKTIQTLKYMKVDILSVTCINPDVEILNYSFNAADGTFTVNLRTDIEPEGIIKVDINYKLYYPELSVYKQTSGELNKYNLSLDDAELTEFTVLVQSINNKSASVTINGDSDYDEDTIYYIVYDEQILLAFKGSNKIYLNVLKTRDYNIYDDAGEIIGHI